jgi:enoyl-CoA hydratase/carnithine racemase
MDLLLTARLMDAEEAARLGLINRVVERDQLIGWAIETAEQIAANSPSAVQAVKRQVASISPGERSVSTVRIPVKKSAFQSRLRGFFTRIQEFCTRRNRRARLLGSWPGPPAGSLAWLFRTA